MLENDNEVEYGAEFVVREKEKHMNWLTNFMGWMFRILLCVVCLITFQVFVINAEIPSESMSNTIQAGDRIFGWRRAYDEDNKPQRYDVIIFRDVTGSGKYLIKRVIGLPGETLIFKDGDVYLENSDEPLDDSFCLMPDVTTQGNLPVDRLTIPEGNYFVMGDNRLNSLDSRYWVNSQGIPTPYVPEEYIVAKAAFRYFPFSQMGGIE